MQVSLGGDATGVQAGAAQVALFDQTYGEAQLYRAQSCGVTGATATEDEDIEFCCCRIGHVDAPLHGSRRPKPPYVLSFSSLSLECVHLPLLAGVLLLGWA